MKKIPLYLCFSKLPDLNLVLKPFKSPVSGKGQRSASVGSETIVIVKWGGNLVPLAEKPMKSMQNESRSLKRCDSRQAELQEKQNEEIEMYVKRTVLWMVGRVSL